MCVREIYGLPCKSCGAFVPSGGKGMLLCARARDTGEACKYMLPEKGAIVAAATTNNDEKEEKEEEKSATADLGEKALIKDRRLCEACQDIPNEDGQVKVKVKVEGEYQEDAKPHVSHDGSGLARDDALAVKEEVKEEERIEDGDDDDDATIPAAAADDDDGDTDHRIIKDENDSVGDEAHQHTPLDDDDGAAGDNTPDDPNTAATGPAGQITTDDDDDDDGDGDGEEEEQLHDWEERYNAAQVPHDCKMGRVEAWRQDVGRYM
ncbi:hypothetical protein Micbo1qcDRAFT_199977 [Microdochium bolleyi]|uniref:Uncharacterized protein n=1 Tax=Microdochium bolleyi TaxID=196109 RepID=A0A136JJD4_9PEZI|nr:hypothetical protein Micbo1qcDRAFT_199977 [Microdochium bolleyi]